MQIWVMTSGPLKPTKELLHSFLSCQKVGWGFAVLPCSIETLPALERSRLRTGPNIGIIYSANKWRLKSPFLVVTFPRRRDFTQSSRLKIQMEADRST